MPRRRVLTDAQLESLIALPRTEPVLVRHWTLDEADLAAIARRRGGGNRLGYALQLCAFRHPGRLLQPGEVLPQPALDFVAEQIHITAGELATYAARRQTRQEQLDELRETFGFRMYGADQSREVSAWLLPVALATTNILDIAATLMDEFRRHRIVAPGPTVIERLVATVLVSAERHVTEQLTRGLSPRQTEALDSLLISEEGAVMSVLAWARQPPEAPNQKALKRTVDQLIRLRAVGLDPACAEGVHPERLRKLAREGGRFTAQHLRFLPLPRRRATLVATVLETVVRLTYDAVGLFDRAVGRMVRRVEAREEGAVCAVTRLFLGYDRRWFSNHPR